MKRHLGMTLIAALLLVPALAAAGDVDTASTDPPQALDVTVMGANEVSIWVQEELGFGTVVAGMSYQQEFDMGVTNTWPDGTWEVSVTGGPLESYTWNCDGPGDCFREFDGAYTIPASAIAVQGFDQNNWDPGVITGGSGPLDGTPTILTGTADANGDIYINDPMSKVTLDLTSLTPDYANYYTELTYTIMHVAP